MLHSQRAPARLHRSPSLARSIGKSASLRPAITFDFVLTSGVDLDLAGGQFRVAS